MKVGDLVAVYGSLRSGLGNHRLLETAKRQTDGIIPSGFCMYSLSAFPGLVKEEPSTNIVVEVYEIDTEQRIQRLDMLEGYPSFYDREEVTLEDGRICWVYFLASKSHHWPQVLDGDWFKYVRGDRDADL